MVHLCMYSATSSLYICNKRMYLSVHGTSEYIPWQALQIWTWDVYTCIYMVYTCIYIRKVVHGSIYMYIHVNTMYIILYALYILGHAYTMYMRVCTFQGLYISWCTIGVYIVRTIAFDMRPCTVYMRVCTRIYQVVRIPDEWRLFSRRPCTCPHPWAGPQSRLQRLDLIIQLSSNSFNLCFTHLPQCQRDLRRRSIRRAHMNRKGCLVLMAIGCPSAPVKMKQVRPP